MYVYTQKGVFVNACCNLYIDFSVCLISRNFETVKIINLGGLNYVQVCYMEQ